MIERIKIKKLFGIYDYDIRLNAENAVTVITGPNGYGKTTLLKIMYHLLKRHFGYFFFLYFEKIEVTFKTDMIITIEKTYIKNDELTDNNPSQASNSKLLFKFSDGSKFSLGPSYLRHLRGSIIHGNIHSNNEPWPFDELSMKDYRDLLEMGYDVEDGPSIIRGKNNKFVTFLEKLSCFYQQAQRLIHEEPEEDEWRRRPWNRVSKLEITRLPKELQDKYLKWQESFAIGGQEIDGTFFTRLLEDKYEKFTTSEIREKISSIEKKIEDYKRYDLVNEKMQIIHEIIHEVPQNMEKISSLYLADMEKKIAIFDDSYDKLSIFDKCVNGKVLSNKIMKLNRIDGIWIENQLKQRIPLEKLSSGEQNLIILYYQLAFNTEKGSLLLIDEPENSLHVAWVEKMLDDYKMIAEKLGCQVVIATHSPIFINGDWDITVDLFNNSNGDGQ